MPSLLSLGNTVKNAISNLLPMSWYAKPITADDTEKGENLLTDESLVTQQSWNKAKGLLGTGLTAAVVSTAAYIAYRYTYAEDNNLEIINKRRALFVAEYDTPVSGNETLINTYTTNAQFNPSISGLSTGGFVVTWSSYGQDGSQDGIYAQIFDDAAVPLGVEFQVNTYTTNGQRNPVVTGLDNSNFIVAWESDNQDGSSRGVYGQRYNNIGGTLGSEFRINTYTTGTQGAPAISNLLDGGFLIAWQSYGQVGTTDSVFAQRYDSAGNTQGSEFLVNTYSTNGQGNPSIATRDSGGFVVVWESNDSGHYGIYGQCYDNSAMTVGGEFLVNTYLPHSQTAPEVVSLSNGGFVVIWASYGQIGAEYAAFGQRYDSACTRVGGEFLVNNDVGYSTFVTLTLTSLMDGSYVLAWNGFRGGSYSHIYGQRSDSSDLVIGNEFLVNDNTVNEQDYPSITTLSNDNIVVAWSSNAQDGNDWGIYAKVFGVNYAPVIISDSLAINEGETKLLTGLNLNATDANNDPVITFQISAVQQGQFELVSAPGISLTNFTLQQIINSEIQFIHDGGEIAPNYNVTATDGNLSSNSEAASITFSNNVNDAPVLVSNHLAVTQGQTTVLVSSNLSATDSDNDSTLLSFNLSNIQNCQFEFVANPGVAVTSFTQLQVTNGSVQFVHDGSAMLPSYEVSVSDGSLSTIPVAASINFNPPTLVNNSLTLNEGETKILTPSDLSATDVESSAMTLIFTASTVSQGQFEMISAPGVAINSFTQQQIIDGEIQFVHDGGELAPTYQISASDSELSSLSESATISFTNVNDIPVLVYNSLSINEGESKVITGANLNATDSDNDPATLLFSASGVQQGQFELVSAPGVAIPSFTQQQITDNAIQFVHDSGEVEPAYNVTVSDGSLGTTPDPATITFLNNVNDAPVLGNNHLAVTQGQTKPLNTMNLSASDVDNNSATLTFNVSSIQNGQFEFLSNPGVAITSFTQQQITNNNVQFVDDGSITSPSYDVSVTDGSLSTSPIAATINFNRPVLSNNSLTINEGETKILTSSDLSATDIESSATSLIFTASNIQQGQFEMVSNPGVAISSFTQPQINNAEIQFVHNGGELAPDYQISVSDGELSSTPATASVSFTNVNDAPVLASNSLTVNEGQTKLITSASLSATDVDSNTATLIFTVNSAQQGQFELVNDPGVAISSFSQQQITNNEIQFVHDGGEVAPSYQISVSDGALSSGSAVAVINFTPVNDAPVLDNNSLTIIAGETKVISSTDLSAIDVDNTDAEIDFIASDIQQGQFELIDYPGSSNTRFTQLQVLDGKVVFRHDGSKQSPQYRISVSDGLITTTATSAIINFPRNLSLVAYAVIGTASLATLGAAALMFKRHLRIKSEKVQSSQTVEKKQLPTSIPLDKQPAAIPSGIFSMATSVATTPAENVLAHDPESWEELFSHLQDQFNLIWETPVIVGQSEQQVELTFSDNDNLNEAFLGKFTNQLMAKSQQLKQSNFSITDVDAADTRIKLTLASNIQAKRFAKLLREKSGLRVAQAQARTAGFFDNRQDSNLPINNEQDPKQVESSTLSLK